ncbi:MAG: dienelactone hydrolase [Candidatus Reconcilbacillus cellulovorans]|uniref:Dienelactone hydrolase n=1 Tax=Candidatus Reconcilbacillus cellulovorans TaxID=1906605 RepID=A0A2A6E3M0_9BACL|nr:MAG: dienelactone hydrolase [Candidatus Reconcilbacillus cellulovorans]
MSVRLDVYLDELYACYERRRQSRTLPPGELRQRLAEALGDFPEREEPLDPVVLERTACDGYIRERVEFGTGDGLRLPAYVLVPAERPGPFPAVLALHGHGFGSREALGLNVDGSERTGNFGIHRRFAVELVRRGLLVVAPEMAGFGDRRLEADVQEGPDRSSCATLAVHLLMYGKTLAGLRVFEARRSIDYMLERPDVDGNRIGCIGFSGGGLVAAYASALDSRIRATALCGFVNTFKGSILARNHCLDNYVPGLLRYAELPEWIGLIAPRPLFVETGLYDRVFPAEHAREALAVLEAVYTSFGAADLLAYDFFPGGHEVGGQRVFDWMAAVLLKV